MILRSAISQASPLASVVSAAPAASDDAPPGLPLRDGPGNVYVPATAADWAGRSLPTPLVQHGCQDEGGSLAPAFGVDAPLAAVGSGHLHRQTIAGWSRKFAGLTLNAVNQAFMYTGALLDIATSESFAWLLYASVAHSTAQNRSFIRFSTNAVGLFIRSDGRLHVQWSGGLGDTSGPVHSGITTVRPWLFYRRSGPNAVGVFTDIRAFTGFHANTANAGGSKGIGTEAGSALDVRLGLSAFWRGTDANTIASAATLTALGWPA